MIGSKFNKWTVTSFSHKKNGNSFYHCRCECGTESTVKDSNLRTGSSLQCVSCASKIRGRKGIYAQTKGSDLYVIKCCDYYKIGTTKNLTERIRTIQSGNPFPLELVYYGVGEGETENYWHYTFEDKHHKGEWYMLTKEDIEFIKETAGGCEI